MDLTIRVADQPSVMPVRIEPVYLKTSAVFLTAPTAAALYIENVHVGSMTLARAGTAYAAAARFSRM